jgi:hypothetical protein
MAQWPAYSKQLERTVIRRGMRAASAPFHHALTAHWIAQRAAAQLRRYTALTPRPRSYAPFSVRPAGSLPTFEG